MSARPALGAGLEETATRLRSGECASKDLTIATIEGLESLGRRLNALVACHRVEALRAASYCDRRLKNGEKPSPLLGVPLAHKDLYLRQGWPIAAGSRLLDSEPAQATAHACARLDAAGALDCARLSTVEFGLGTTGHNEITGPVHNPWNPDFITGGSSSGSAAAVAAGLVPAALGSDTGGSVRLPAAACGLVGLKPTFGLVGRSGVIPLSHSLDTLGPLTRNVRDCALMLQAIAGYDPKDPVSRAAPVPDYLETIEDGIADLRIGVPCHYLEGAMDEDAAKGFATAETALKTLGKAEQDVTIEGIEMSNRVTTLIIAVEGAAVHSQWLQTRAGDYGSQTLGRLMAGLFVPAEAYVRALEYRQRFLKQTLESLFQDIDLLLTPMWPFRLPTIEESDLGGNPGFSAMVMASGHYSRPFNLLGLPAITLPCGRCSRGLPLGLQLVGRPFEEALLLRAAPSVRASPRSAGRQARALGLAIRALAEVRVWVQEAPNHIAQQPGDVVVIAIAGQAAAEGDRADREHRAATGRLVEQHVGPDQRFARIAGQGRGVGQLLLGHQHEEILAVRLVAARAGDHHGMIRGAETRIGAVQLEARGTAAAQSEVAQAILFDAREHPGRSAPLGTPGAARSKSRRRCLGH